MAECCVCKYGSAIYKRIAMKSAEHIICEICGEFILSDSVVGIILQDEAKRLMLSSLLIERKYKNYNPIAIFINNQSEQNNTGLEKFNFIQYDELMSTFPVNLFEKINRVLMLISTMVKYPGEVIKIPVNAGNYFFAEGHGFFEKTSIFNFMKEMNYIEGDIHLDYFECVITVKGWKEIYELESHFETSNAFVAMWFSDEMNSPYTNAVSKAIEANGYNPIRIDKVDHNNKIDDEIIANIKRSKFVVADFTGHRGGVYFEAGYALGLGLPVIWTCRKDHLEDLHFDTRQYSHLVWETEEELFRLLDNRIKATIIPNNAQSKDLIKR